jgi:hypothetical protein
VTSNVSPAWIVPPTSAFATGSSLALKTTTISEPSTAALELEPDASIARWWKF